MLRLLIATLLVLPSFGQEKQPAPPDKALVDSTVANLEAAFKEGRTPDKVTALEAAAKVSDKKVVAAIAKGLKSKEHEVVIATFDALRWNTNEKALGTLEKYYKKNQKKLKSDGARLPPLLRAIAWHGQESSIPILVEDPFALRQYDAIQARLYGLANIRSVKSIEAIVDLVRKVSQNKAEDYATELRLAMFRLTGTDQGPSLELWGTWWRGVKKGYKIPEAAPAFSEAQQQQWDTFWGIEKKKDEGGER